MGVVAPVDQPVQGAVEAVIPGALAALIPAMDAMVALVDVQAAVVVHVDQGA